jgi:hypothetical protein
MFDKILEIGHTPCSQTRKSYNESRFLVGKTIMSGCEELCSPGRAMWSSQLIVLCILAEDYSKLTRLSGQAYHNECDASLGC